MKKGFCLAFSFWIFIFYHPIWAQEKGLGVQHTSTTANDFPKIDPKDAGKIMKMLAFLDQYLIRKKIKYSIECGTFLGAVRHGGLIPWDDDADIVIKEEDAEKLETFEDELYQMGYDLHKTFFGYKLRKKNQIFPFVDIFLIRHIASENRWVYANERARRMWKKTFYTTEEFENIRRWKFGDITLNGPISYKRYFNNIYGKDWERFAYLMKDHKNRKRHEDRRALIITDFAPAAWEYEDED